MEKMELEYQARLVCQAVFKLGLVEQTSGNLSFRCGSEKVFITKTGCCLDDPIFVDIESFEASSDVRLHKEIYRLNPYVMWVLHVHKKGCLRGADVVWKIDQHGEWLGFNYAISSDLFETSVIGG